VIFVLIALVISLVVGIGIYKSKHAETPPAATTVAAPAAKGANIHISDGVVNLYLLSVKPKLQQAPMMPWQTL
jgi:hypothetical protein